jgi:hypothetical protein
MEPRPAVFHGRNKEEISCEVLEFIRAGDGRFGIYAVVELKNGQVDVLQAKKLRLPTASLSRNEPG